MDLLARFRKGFVFCVFFVFFPKGSGSSENCEYLARVGGDTESRYVYCEYGCCGTKSDQKCCNYTLSESVIIVACVVGSLVVIAVVVALILCIKGKNKNRVTRLRQRNRERGVDIIRPVVQVPKPPPYVSAPPDYDASQENHRSFAGFAIQPPGLPAHLRQNAPTDTSLRRAQSHRLGTQAAPLSSRAVRIDNVDEPTHSQFYRNTRGERATLPRRNMGPNRDIFTTQTSGAAMTFQDNDIDDETDVNSVTVPEPITFTRQENRQRRVTFDRNTSSRSNRANGGIFIPETGDTLQSSRTQHQGLPVHRQRETSASRGHVTQEPTNSGQFIDLFQTPRMPQTVLNVGSNSVTETSNSGPQQTQRQPPEGRGQRNNSRRERMTSLFPTSPPPTYSQEVIL